MIGDQSIAALVSMTLVDTRVHGGGWTGHETQDCPPRVRRNMCHRCFTSRHVHKLNSFCMDTKAHDRCEGCLLPSLRWCLKTPVVMAAGGDLQVDVNFVTALVPSDTACLASSPGRMRRTAVCVTAGRRVSALAYCCSQCVTYMPVMPVSKGEHGEGASRFRFQTIDSLPLTSSRERSCITGTAPEHASP